MKIKSVRANHRRRCFEVRTARGWLPFPFVRADRPPSARDRVVRVYVEPEVANEGFTYELASGVRDTILCDWVLKENRDPRLLTELLVHDLTCSAVDELARSGLSTRELCRRLSTSASQLYRLLDPANAHKSVEQLLRLLVALGCEVRFDVKVPARHRRA